MGEGAELLDVSTRNSDTTGLPRPSLLTRRLALRPLNQADHGRLYELSVTPRTIHTWRFAGAVPTFEEFVQSLNQGVHFQLVIAKRDSFEPIGLINLYNANFRHGYAYLATIVEPSLQSTGIGMEAVFAFVYYSFSVWPLSKIYFESLDSNWQQMKSGLRRGVFHEEGCLRSHAYVEGRRQDYHIAAIYRDVATSNPFFARMLSHYLIADERSTLAGSPNSQRRQAPFVTNITAPNR